MNRKADRFIPYEKLSKKERKKIDSIRRGNWNGVDPVTKVVKSKKLYTRKGRRNDKKSFEPYFFAHESSFHTRERGQQNIDLYLICR